VTIQLQLVVVVVVVIIIIIIINSNSEPWPRNIERKLYVLFLHVTVLINKIGKLIAGIRSASCGAQEVDVDKAARYQTLS
jgi:hypothetical protein